DAQLAAAAQRRVVGRDDVSGAGPVGVRPAAMNEPARLAGSATKMSLESSLAGVPERPVDTTERASKIASLGPPLAAAMQTTSRNPSPLTLPIAVRSPPRKAESEIPKGFDTRTGVPPTREEMIVRGPPRSSGLMTHSAFPSPSMPPALTYSPAAKFVTPI